MAVEQRAGVDRTAAGHAMKNHALPEPPLSSWRADSTGTGLGFWQETLRGIDERLSEFF
jgi:hypothetical protein